MSLRRRPLALVWPWAIWALFASIASISGFTDNGNWVVFIYRSASISWLSGEPVYSGTGRDFLYLPQSAILYVPFAVMGQVIGGILWKTLNIALFAVGTHRLLGKV